MRRIAFALLLAAGAACAQQATSAPASTAVAAVQPLSWTAIDGQAAELAVGGDGSVFALDFQGQVWLRRPGAAMSWLRLPGAFRRIAAVAGAQAWAVGEGGEVYFYNGTWWRPLGERFPVEAVDIGTSIHGAVFAVSKAGKLVALDAARGVIEVPDAPERLARVAVDDRDLPWVVDRDSRVHRFDGKQWWALDLRGRKLAAGNGGVWLVGTEGEVVALNPDGTVPRPVAARAATLALAPGGLPWIATADGRIYANNPNTATRSRARGDERAQVFTQLLNWQRVNGSARQLAISPHGAVLALGREGEVWQWKSRNNWGRLPGSFGRIALDKDNTPWAIAADGRIMRFQGSYWTEVPGSARDLAAGSNGGLWIVQADGTPAFWDERQRTWQALAPAVAVNRLAIAPDGRPWAINERGNVVRFDGRQWEALPELEAIELAIGPEGSVFVVGADKRLWRWDGAGKRWERLNGEAATVAVGPRGKPWIATPDATIYASAFFDELPDSKVNTVSVAAANAAKVSLGGTPATGVVGQPGTGSGGAAKGKPNEPLQYHKVAGTARDISIGADGSVFVVTFDGGLARWSNTRNAFVGFIGQFARIAVTPGGLPWGITTRGEVFRHDGIEWKQVRNIAAQDIAVGFDGTVIASGPQDTLYKYDPAIDSFIRLPQIGDNAPPAGVRVAVDPAGKPWVIGSDGFVARCVSGACERLPIRARSIDIGPEGSVVIVDADRALKRWNPREEKFERIDGIADVVDLAAVGPRGKPWLLSAKSEVWASEFFMRDESRDAATAAVTATVQAQSALTGATVPPVFTFLINLTFDRITYPAGFFDNPPGFKLAINPVTGNPVIIDAAPSFQFWNYNQVTRQWALDTTPGSLLTLLSGDIVRSFAIGKDGTYWISNSASGPAPRVYRRQGSQWIAVPGLSDCQADECLYTPMTVAVGPDGTVYATSNGGRLYRYDTMLQRFVALNIPLPPDAGYLNYVGVDPNGRIWAASTVSDKIYEHVGNAWVTRLTLPSFGNCIDWRETCFSIGANGSVYSKRIVSGDGKLIRWNAGSQAWDVVSTSPDPGGGGDYAIGPDGRPWVIQMFNPTPAPGFGFYRAR